MARWRRYWRYSPYLIGILLTLGLIKLELETDDHSASGLQRVENLFYDIRLRTLPSQRPANAQPVIIIDIDEKSLNEVGQFPWPRETVAQLVRALQQHNVAIIGFDLLFSEPQRNPVDAVARALASHSPLSATQKEWATEQLDGDRELAAALSTSENVLGFVFHHNTPSRGAPPSALTPLTPEQLRDFPLSNMAAYTNHIPSVVNDSTRFGFFNITPDGDGVLRSAALLQRYQDSLYPSLALEMARAFLLANQVTLESEYAGNTQRLTGVALAPQHIIPLTRDGRLFIPYIGGEHAFPYFSATDILHHRIANDALQNAIVIIGTSALGLNDLRATPLRATFPGVEVHANIVAAILDQRYLIKPDWNDAANFLIILFFGTVLSLWLPQRGPVTALVFWSASMGIVVLFNAYLWLQYGWILSLATPLMLVTIITICNVIYGHFFIAGDKRRLQHMFGQYVPPAHVERMASDSGQFGFDGETRDMTVLFCDIRDFTSTSESLSANELKQFLNAFFTPMTRIIFEHNGTIDKYVGDMIMAFWGAPLDDPSHRQNALRAAMTMQRECAALRQSFAQRGWPVPFIGIGLNSGEMNVGDMGSSYRRAYTVLGDAVNLASRIEGLTKFYGVEILVSEYVTQNNDAVLFRFIDCVKVKGKARSVSLFEPVALRASCNAEQIVAVENYAAAFKCYQSRQWQTALAQYQQLQLTHHDTVSRLMIERIINCQQHPPSPDWDGSFLHHAK